MSSREQIESAAADWLARQDCGPWTAADESRLANWLEASMGHRAAYWRLRSAWQKANRLKALGGAVEPGTIPAREKERRGPPGFDLPATVPRAKPRGRWRVLLPWAAAAGVVLAISATQFQRPLFDTGRYSTPIGGLSAVPLPDGSKVTLNTDSEIRVSVNERERRISLQHGEAFFEVARDPARPFVVVARNKRVVAVGTKFSVRAEGEDVRVVVTEGQVRVEQPADGGQYRPVAHLPAGSIARAGDSGVLVQAKPLAEAEEALSWRNGYVVFQNVALVEAVAEFNRYNTRKILIEDPAVGAIRIGGNFRPTNVDAFIRLLRDDLAIEVDQQGSRIVLRKAP